MLWTPLTTPDIIRLPLAPLAAGYEKMPNYESYMVQFLRSIALPQQPSPGSERSTGGITATPGRQLSPQQQQRRQQYQTEQLRQVETPA
jgi:hypothetical protein